MNHYLTVLKKYATFSGRATRSEYWFFILFNIIISFVLGFIDGFIGKAGAEESIGIIGSIYSLAVLIPSLAVLARRLHDTNRSGWWMLIGLIPLVGWIILLVFTVGDSGPDNKYGPNPKGMRTATATAAPAAPAAPSAPSASAAAPEMPSNPPSTPNM